MLFFAVRDVGSSTWKCPAGQTGEECTVVQIYSTILANANFIGRYEKVMSGGTCTGRTVYRLASHNKFIAFMHVGFWPYISAWMIFDNDPRLSVPNICTEAVTSLSALETAPGMKLMLQTSDLTLHIGTRYHGKEFLPELFMTLIQLSLRFVFKDVNLVLLASTAVVVIA